MRKTACFFAVVVSFLAAAASARAQSQGFYLGAGAGSANASFKSSDFNLGIAGVNESADKKSTGVKAFAGFRFHKNFAAEAGYADLGTFHYNYNGTGATGTATVDYKVSGFTLSGIAIWPASEAFSLFVRLGAFASKTKASASNATGPVFGSLAGVSASASKTNLYYGAGAEYDFLSRFGVRVEYENYGEVGDSDNTGRATVTLISASLLYRF